MTILSTTVDTQIFAGSVDNINHSSGGTENFPRFLEKGSLAPEMDRQA
jgi:hypothetical protein